MFRPVYAARPLGRTHQNRRVFAHVLGTAVGLVLAGCSSPVPNITATVPRSVQPVPPAEPAQPEAASDSAQPPAARAAEAFQAQRLFAPEGDNAFELYLEALALEPDNVLVRNALTDLFPYAVMHVEQRLHAKDADDAARVLGLMKRVDPAAPALPRLADTLEATRAANEAEPAREAQAAAAVVADNTSALRIEPTARAPAVAAPVRVAPDADAFARAGQSPVSAAPTAAPLPTPVDATPSRSLASVAPASTRSVPALLSSAAGSDLAVASQTPARYPPQAERRRLEGHVELQFTVGTDGRVSNVQVVHSQPEGVFDREAIRAMQRWRFAPPTQAVQARRVFDFKLVGTSG